MGNPLVVDEVWLERITQSLNGLEFGTVQIVVHGGRIVQIERTERNRFELETSAPPKLSKQLKAKKNNF